MTSDFTEGPCLAFNVGMRHTLSCVVICFSLDSHTRLSETEVLNIFIGRMKDDITKRMKHYTTYAYYLAELSE